MSKGEKRTNKTHHFLVHTDSKWIYIMLGLVFRHKIKKGFFLNFRALVISQRPCTDLSWISKFGSSCVDLCLVFSHSRCWNTIISCELWKKNKASVVPWTRHKFESSAPELGSKELSLWSHLRRHYWSSLLAVALERLERINGGNLPDESPLTSALKSTQDPEECQFPFWIVPGFILDTVDVTRIIERSRIKSPFCSR